MQRPRRASYSRFRVSVKTPSGEVRQLARTVRRLDRSALFASHDRDRDLSRRSVRGGCSALLAQAAHFTLRTAGTVVLARLLTPDDFGLIGMAYMLLEITLIQKFILFLGTLSTQCLS